MVGSIPRTNPKDETGLVPSICYMLRQDEVHLEYSTSRTLMHPNESREQDLTLSANVWAPIYALVPKNCDLEFRLTLIHMLHLRLGLRVVPAGV
jgi:hypothetical protein